MGEQEWWKQCKTKRNQSEVIKGESRCRLSSLMLFNALRDQGERNNVYLASACDGAASRPLNDQGGFWNGNSCHKFTVWSYKGNLGMLNNPGQSTRGHGRFFQASGGDWESMGTQCAHWWNKDFSQCSQVVGSCQKQLSPKVRQTQGC